MSYEMTNDDFEIFKEEAERWITALGLKDWNISIKMDNAEDACSECLVNRTSHAACLVLNRYQQEELTQKQIREYAFHEVLEVLLSDLEYLAMDCLLSEEKKVLLEVERHRIIRRLESAKSLLEA